MVKSVLVPAKSRVKLNISGSMFSNFSKNVKIAAVCDIVLPSHMSCRLGAGSCGLDVVGWVRGWEFLSGSCGLGVEGWELLAGSCWLEVASRMLHDGNCGLAIATLEL